MAKRKSGVVMTHRPKSPKIQYNLVRQAVREELKPVAATTTRSLDRVVDNWTHKPNFKTTIFVVPGQIRLETKITNRRQKVNRNLNIGGLWKLINDTGAKPHTIKPRKPGGVLVYNWGGKRSYQAKTGANPARFGGSGKVRGGKKVFSRQVNHPGFPPRHLDKAVKKDLRPRLNRRIDAGFKKGWKDVMRANKR